MLRTHSKRALVALALLATACSTDDESVTQVEMRESAAPLEEQRAGSLLVEYNPALSNGVSVHAQFLEVQGVSLEAAFDALDAWSPDRALGEDACSIRVPPESDSENVRLRMLDVGPIAVSALNHGIELEGRRVPDLRSFSGVVYGNEEGFDFDEAFLPYEPAARYQISAPGGDEAEGFGVSLQAPAVPSSSRSAITSWSTTPRSLWEAATWLCSGSARRTSEPRCISMSRAAHSSFNAAWKTTATSSFRRPCSTSSPPIDRCE